MIKMVQDESYCIDVLHQSQAVQKAIKETDDVILENHLNTCAADAIAKGEKERAIHEVMSVFKKART